MAFGNTRVKREAEAMIDHINMYVYLYLAFCTIMLGLYIMVSG
jgi:hypothetical protein